MTGEETTICPGSEVACMSLEDGWLCQVCGRSTDVRQIDGEWRTKFHVIPQYLIDVALEIELAEVLSFGIQP